MRTTILCLVLSIPAVLLAQTAAPQPRPPRVLSPDDNLHAAANAAFAAEAAREKAGDCPGIWKTYDVNMCLAHEDEITEANLKAFAAAIRAMLASAPTSDYVGPTGTAATPASNAAAFDKAQAAWQAYATAGCDAVDTYWRGGTIVNSMDIQCSLRMSRARLHELNTAYDNLLHPH